MVTSWIVMLSVAAVAIASPVPVDENKVKEAPLVEVVEVVETVPVLVPVLGGGPDAAEARHLIAKRSALRGDNPSNDLLASLEGLKYETGLSSLDGRRIKFLPTWLG